MRVGILRARDGWHLDQLEAALKERGATVERFSWTRLSLEIGSGAAVASAGRSLEGLDALIPRVIPLASLEQIMFRMNTLRRVEAMGVRVVNRPEAIEKTVDKSYTSHILADAGLPTPRTLVAEGMEEAMAAFESLRDAVVKPLHGSCGLGMTRISDPDTAYRVFRAMEQNRFVYYLQEFIESGGSDLRVFVAGGRAVAAMRRRGDGWRHNYHRGAKVESAEATPAQVDFAARAARLLGLDYAGVDFLPGPGGTDYIIEVNGIPGWRGLQSVARISVAGAIADMVVHEARQAPHSSRGR